MLLRWLKEHNYKIKRGFLFIKKFPFFVFNKISIMKYIDNEFYFIPRFANFNEALSNLTVDSTFLTIDNTFITADQTTYFTQGDFILEFTNELTKEISYPQFEWEYVGSFIKISLEKTFTGNYSVHIYDSFGTIYKGRFASECIRTLITNNKMYL